MDHISSTIAERVLRFLELEIIETRIPPLQHLAEDEIARQLGVSRSPVREALRRLQYLGLVTIVPRRGAVVRALDPHGAADLYMLHACVSGLIGRLAAQNRKPNDIADFEGVIRELRLALRHEDRAKFLSLYPEVMRILTRMTGSQWIERALETWEKPARRYGFAALSLPGYMQEVLRRYESVLEAVKTGDAAKAESVLRSSLEAGGRKLARFLERAAAASAHGEDAVREPSGADKRRRRGRAAR
jgi:DNA-binding GntR family transcriptional regulator